ncbi:hypothetical protein Q0Z83_035470 [Actinoplanes sichuanensis]|uniref:Uncharacterized protein n=1 Tax=Actinoplanes sichuanensis TaxID=512349 RepID=A0ABW4ABW0_9ACTN|nr:hypothetical protein [Actinoplanes sichuanensis]BEL05356.1 hypothetical protein Q0Z83_035470 [Actinoplanes sichuanensis]
MHRRVTHLLLMIGFAIGAYLALSAFDRAAWADGVLPAPPAPIGKPAVDAGKVGTSTVPRKAVPSKPVVPKAEQARSDQRRAASARPVDRKPTLSKIGDRKRPVQTAVVRDLSNPPSAKPVSRAATSRAPSRAVSASANPPKAAATLNRTPEVGTGARIAASDPTAVIDAAVRPSLPRRLPALPPMPVVDVVVDLLPEAGQPTLRSTMAVVNAVVDRLQAIPQSPTASVGSVSGRLPAPGLIVDRSSVDRRLPPAVVAQPLPATTCPAAAPAGGWPADTSAGSSTAGVRAERTANVLRSAPVTPEPPVAPTGPDGQSAGCGGLRDSGGGHVPSTGDVPSSWWPGIPAAGTLAPEQASTTGRSVRYCSPPS